MTYSLCVRAFGYHLLCFELSTYQHSEMCSALARLRPGGVLSMYASHPRPTPVSAKNKPLFPPCTCVDYYSYQISRFSRMSRLVPSKCPRLGTAPSVTKVYITDSPRYVLRRDALQIPHLGRGKPPALVRDNPETSTITTSLAGIIIYYLPPHILVI